MSTKRVLIFDLDGTLYRLKGGSYANSLLQTAIHENTRAFITQRLSCDSAEVNTILAEIHERYSENISIGLEAMHSIARAEYFEFVWDMPAAQVLERIESVYETIESLSREYELVLLSDAPRVWVDRVLEHLGLQRLFEERIYSGDGDVRKTLRNAFPFLLKELGVRSDQCVSIGDQEKTDIVPANELGMKSVIVSSEMISTSANYVIYNVIRLPRILKMLW